MAIENQQPVRFSVNFNKLIPKASAIKSSAVLKELNEEAIKTVEDKMKEKAKWTTFLQKPNRPIPKSKEELAREKLPQYKVKIVKQPKPRGAPGREPTPTPSEPEVVPEEVKEEPQPEEEKEVPQEVIVEEPPEEPLTNEVIEEIAAATEDNEVPDLVGEVPEQPAGIPSELEKQLADVQKQLLALSNLPQAIQATLDAVTHELAKIVQVASKQASVDRDYRSKSPSRDIEEQATEMVVIEETVEELEDERPKQGAEEVPETENSSCSSRCESSQGDACSLSSAPCTPATPAVPRTKEQQLEDHQKELRDALANRKNQVRK